MPCSLASPLRPLTPSQSHSLSILLELGDELVPLLDNIIILLILVVWSVGLDDSLPSHTVNGAGDASTGDELSKITEYQLVESLDSCRPHLPV